MSHWARTLSWASLYEDNGLAGAISGSLHVMDPSMGGSGVGTGGHDGIDANALAVGAEKSRAKAQIVFMAMLPAQRAAARTQPRDSWHVEKGVAKGRSTAPLVCVRWMMIVRSVGEELQDRSADGLRGKTRGRQTKSKAMTNEPCDFLWLMSTKLTHTHPHCKRQLLFTHLSAWSSGVAQWRSVRRP